MHYFNTILCVIFNLLIVTNNSVAVIQYRNFKVHLGYAVNTVDETITVRSVTVCAAACNEKNDVTPNSCITSTYNAVTKECQLSSQGLSDTTSGLGALYKTVAFEEDCSQPSSIAYGNLVIASQNSTGSFANLQCNTGYGPKINSPLTAQCSDTSGWLISGIGCSLPPETSYYGTSFVVGFMKNGADNAGVPTIIVTCQSGEASVSISIPHLLINEQTSTVGGILTKEYSTTLSSATSGLISTNAIYVTSDNPVMLFAGSMKSGSSDISYVLPETSLGNSYIISGHPSTNAGMDEFLVIATSDSTQVTLNFNSGSPENITLNRLDTYYHQSTDKSGTMISADAPIFVLSGHVCANIPDNAVNYCDYIGETMPPISSLGSVHILSFMKPRPDFTISVVAPYDHTSVRIQDDLGNDLETFSLMAKSAAFRTYTGSASISVTTDSPVLVTQYGHGSTLTLGDPSMMVISDVSFFGHVYDFSVPTGFNTPSTLTIVMSDSYSTSGLLLNDMPLTTTQTKTIIVTGYGTYNILYVDVEIGYNHISHSQGNMVSFGAWIYGRTNNQEYASLLGMLA